MTYEIVFFDIDGTILKPDHTVCPTTIEAINELHRQDVYVYLATGRPIHGIKELAEKLNIHSYIGYNGAYATYKGETIVNEPMDSDIITQFVQTAEQHGHEMVLYTNGENYFTSPHTSATIAFKKLFDIQNDDLFTTEVVRDVLGTTILNVYHDERTKYETADHISLAQVNIAGFEHSYDIIRSHVNKGSAVEAILNELNIPAERAVAFGDGLNDKEMFQSVGASFAMANGHKDLFPFAKYQTTAAADAGIYNGLKRIGLIK